MRCFVLLLVIMTVPPSMAQSPNLLRGQVLAPDGTPLRNAEGVLYLKATKLSDRETFAILFAIRTDVEGFIHSPRPIIKTVYSLPKETLRAMEQDMWKVLEQLKGKRVVAWIYLAIPKVGALMTHRFVWTVGEALPELRLKPPARLKVQLVYPVLNVIAPWLTIDIRRADDPEAVFPKETEWFPAGEWLSVGGFSLLLQPEEEQTLILPAMPANKIPVRINCFPPQVGKESLPPLVFDSQLLPYDGWQWKGIVEIDRTDPFQFVLVPPRHILRLPVEQLPMSPLADTLSSLDSHRLYPKPIAEVELEVVDKESKPLGSHLTILTFHRTAWERIGRLLFSPHARHSLQKELWEQLACWWQQGIGSAYVGSHQPRIKLWLTRWTPLFLQVHTGSWLCENVLAFPLKVQGAERIFARLQVNFPQRPLPSVLAIKTGRLEGIVQTLDGKPVADHTLVARFVESELVDWLNADDAIAFYTKTDKEGRFTFPTLPEGKYDLWVDTLSWTGCVQAVVHAGKTTKVVLVGDFITEEKPHPRTITLRLQFPDGMPVTNCYVDVYSYSGLNRNGHTDEQGRITMQVKDDRLEINAYGFAHCIPVQLAPDQKEVTVTVPVTLYGRVEGRVLLPDGATRDQVLVTAWRIAKREWMPRMYPEKVASWRILPDGRFFGILPEDVYVFRAEVMPSEIANPDAMPSLSTPVFVKAGEVAKVEWQLSKRRSWTLMFEPTINALNRPSIATLFIRREIGGQVYENREQLPLPLAWAEPLAALDDEATVWDGTVEASPGFYRITSWDWEGNKFNGVVRVSESVDAVTLTPTAAFPTLTVTGRVISPEGQPVPYAVVALYDPDQAMRRFATVCDEKGSFRLTVRVPTKEILERQHLNTLLPNSRHELWLVAWKFGYGHSLLRRILRPQRKSEVVNVGALTLAAEKRLEGRVVDEKGKPFAFASIIMLPIDTNLFSPTPSEATLWQELTAFESDDVGSLPHAYADAQGRFRVDGLREGRYLLVAKAIPKGEQIPSVAYRFVQIPTSPITVQLAEPKSVLKGSPQSLSEALPLAEVRLTMPCWHNYTEIRTDAAGNFHAEVIPLAEGVPLRICLFHRNGIAVTINPPNPWHYTLTLRP